MKILIFIFLICFGVLLSKVQADIIYLRNGREIEGIITKETNEFVELSVGWGIVKFYRTQIKRISYSSKDENLNLQKAWEEKRLKRKQEEQKLASREIKAKRLGDHLLVNALLNEKINAKLMVDSGASLVVLSSNIAKELGINIKDTNPDTKFTLADGTQIDAKLSILL